MPKDFPPVVLDASVLSDEARAMRSFLLSKIIGQDRACETFVKVYQQISVGLNREGRPAGVFLFTGSTGVGKTALVKRAAEFLLGKQDAITRVDCGEFQASHEISKLIGSPPGYVGYNDKESIRLSQEHIDKYQTPTHKINFLLFDEIEEAHDALLSAILQILDAGRLTLGNGGTTDFTKTIVVLTSNLGEKEIQQTLAGGGLGLRPASTLEVADEQIYKASKAASMKYFKAKFMNRVDRIIVFRTLSEESLLEILKIELNAVQERIWKAAINKWEADGAQTPVPVFRPLIKVTDTAKAFLIKEGTSRIYGARELNRAIDRFISFPLGSLIGSKQIQEDDIVEIDYAEGEKKLAFRRIGKREGMIVRAEKAVVPEPAPEPPKTPPRKPWGLGF